MTGEQTIDIASAIEAQAHEGPSPREGVEDYPCTSATELLELVSPMHSLWAEKPSAWIYRGQADANWQLKSTADRNPKAFNDFGIAGEDSMHTLVQRFKDRIEQAGLPLPASVPPLGRIGTQPSLVAMLALAQHHGLPSQLLDWTRRARYAAYFAAADAAAKDSKTRPSHLAVWALRLQARNYLLEIHRAPFATNPNLRAQEGLFTAQWDRETRALCLEHAAKVIEAREPGTATLRRMTLPTSEAPKLLRLLSYEGVDGASMFPGVDGVVRAMRENALWDKPDTERSD
jgi:hypothetical protein